MIESHAVSALAALAHEHRLRIFRLLVREGPSGVPAGEIAERVGVSPTSVSFHLKELDRAGLVTATRQGRFIRYAVRVEFNPGVTDESFRYAPAGYKAVQPVPDQLEEKVDRLADGVYVIQNVAGQNQNTLAVGFADYVAAIEAPGSSDGADAVIKRIHELFPGKPIRYVAMTHHHGAHIGGMRSFIAEGATVVTTAANRPVIEAMAATKQNDRLGSAPRKPEFLLLENGRRVLEDGGRRVELIDIGPNPHAKEMVIAWLPAEKIVFQGDLFFVPNNDAPFGPPQPATVSFARKLRELKLPAEKIASVHGDTATIEQFRVATASVN